MTEERNAILWGAAGDELSGSDYSRMHDRYGPSQNVSWMNDQIGYLTSTAAGGKHTRCAFACWFDTAEPISNPTPGTNPAWIAAARDASRRYFFDPTRFVL